MTSAGKSMEASLFREVMARFPAGVVVVTAVDRDGIAAGLTVSAFCSVSAAPPIVLVCIDRFSNTLPAIRASEMFTVNILAAGREELARAFASKSSEKFSNVRHSSSPRVGGGPILHEDAAAHLVCRVHWIEPAGDHWVVTGEVLEAGLGEDRPLVYHNRAFHTLG